MNIRKIMRKFARNNDGATAIEYALIAGVISLGLIAAAGALEDNISAEFGEIGTAVEGLAP